MRISKNKGFGPQNLRVVILIVVATFVSILGIVQPLNTNAAFGILGAIAGYLFGVPINPKKTDEKNAKKEMGEKPK